jgi:hypothetical protein
MLLGCDFKSLSNKSLVADHLPRADEAAALATHCPGEPHVRLLHNTELEQLADPLSDQGAAEAIRRTSSNRA